MKRGKTNTLVCYEELGPLTESKWDTIVKDYKRTDPRAYEAELWFSQRTRRLAIINSRDEQVYTAVVEKGSI